MIPDHDAENDAALLGNLVGQNQNYATHNLSPED